ncbi:hypothetical protein GCM10009844_15310 [Nocardioides koreensis]|uniref:DUF4386 family protein n=1 Tax=Nocardioides koreensis TaxID=433651 RepID=A0ABN2ZJG9_9ACTN
MTTHVTTHNPARSDVLDTPSPEIRTRPRKQVSRTWALAGIGSALLGAGTIVTTSMVDTVYTPEFEGTTTGISADLQDKAPLMFAFHSIAMTGAILMIVFAAGLFRRLRTAMPDSIAPTVAFAGLAGTAVVSVLGAGLDTEYMMAFAQGGDIVDDANAAMYNHWIGTIPWLWVLAGLAGLALFSAARQGVVPRWIGRVGLVLGGLTVVLGISPLEYMSGVTGVLWLLVTALGFTLGDKRYRTAAR